MDELVEEGAGAVPTVGERLREAREARKLSLEEVASQTRIPVRHLASIETGEWDRLPAQTYSIGFAKNYAGAVGLDRNEIGEQLRFEMGGYRPASAMAPTAFEPVDPKRQMPKGLVFGALGALVLVAILLTWLSNREVSDGNDEVVAADNAMEPPVTPPAATPVAANVVTVTATDAAWVEIKDGLTVLKQGELAAGETFAVPPGAAAPTLSTATPESLSIKVGGQVAPPIGPAGKKVSDVSLKPEALLHPVTATPAPAAPAKKALILRPKKPAAKTKPLASAPEAPSPPTTTPTTTTNAN